MGKTKFPIELTMGDGTHIWIKNEYGLVQALDFLEFLQEAEENREGNGIEHRAGGK